jgi:hypothetical protein
MLRNRTGARARPPRRGGRLSRPHQEPTGTLPSTQVLIVLMAGFLVLGIVAGFAWSQDRLLRGGILQQRAEAMQREDWVPLEEIPAAVVDAFMTVVQPGFEQGRTLQRPRDEGQTVPRRLVRQVHMLGSGMAGEARERFMAPVLEQRLSRRQQLELFLNRVYLGRASDFPLYGIHGAAAEYLGKHPRELTLGESATLAGLLLPPMIERPDERPGAVGARRNEVLRALLQEGRISPEEYQQAISERLAFQPGLRDLPMSRPLPLPDPGAVIRLPPEFRPDPADLEETPD